MTTTFFLVRHAVHDQVSRRLSARTPGVGLSEQGRAQAEWVADRLTGEDIAAIHASPQQRAQETAQPLAERLGIAVITAPALDEFDAGEWTGRTFDDLSSDPAWTRWNTARSVARAPCGESAMDVTHRIVTHVAEVASARPGGSIVLVSHAEPLRSLLLFALGLGTDAWNRIEITPAGVSVLTVGEWGCKLLQLNEFPPPTAAKTGGLRA